MKKGLIWGTGKIFNDTITAIKYHQNRGNFEIKAVTSKEPNVYIYDYARISKEDINSNDYDFVIIMAEGAIYNNIKSEALKHGFKKEQLILARVVKHPLFEINKYLEILKKPPTIFSNHCWGGFTYNNLGMEFLSPTINMFFSDEDYIKFLKQPKFYLEQELKFYKWQFEKNFKRDFPVASCADILLYFNHATDFICAKTDWERRIKRIKWDNLFCMMQTCNPNIEEQFNNLPYDKKICFVPYKTDKKYSSYVDIKIEKSQFHEIIFRLGAGVYLYYDPFELLLTGTAKKLV